MMDNKNNKHSPAFDLEALTKAYEQSLNDVTLGGKDIPTPEARRTARNTKPIGELKSFVPEDFSPMNESGPEHDKIVDKNGTREVATEYLNYLYSEEAQRIAGQNFYRPSNEKVLAEFKDTFDLNINLVTINDFGGWDEAFAKHFADGGLFDQIYEQD